MAILCQQRPPLPPEKFMRTWIPDNRFLPYLTWKQVEALDKKSSLIILPTAAIEQHGHHLPLATDTLLNNFILGRALELIPAEMQEQRASWLSGNPVGFRRHHDGRCP
jgi:creatinine amidohydrolase/Fe(II)-dependent formamide hydrolase-like protein